MKRTHKYIALCLLTCSLFLLLAVASVRPAQVHASTSDQTPALCDSSSNDPTCNITSPTTPNTTAEQAANTTTQQIIDNPPVEIASSSGGGAQDKSHGGGGLPYNCKEGAYFSCYYECNASGWPTHDMAVAKCKQDLQVAIDIHKNMYHFIACDNYVITVLSTYIDGVPSYSAGGFTDCFYTYR